MSEKRAPVLSSLKYPLVFFGLALLVLEAVFGAKLLATDDVDLYNQLMNWIGGLFLFCVLVVAFLVYKVPQNLMLESQKELNQTNSNLKAQIESLETTLQEKNSQLTKTDKIITETKCEEKVEECKIIEEIKTILSKDLINGGRG